MHCRPWIPPERRLFPSPPARKCDKSRLRNKNRYYRNKTIHHGSECSERSGLVSIMKRDRQQCDEPDCKNRNAPVRRARSTGLWTVTYRPEWTPGVRNCRRKNYSAGNPMKIPSRQPIIPPKIHRIQYREIINNIKNSSITNLVSKYQRRRHHLSSTP